MSKKEFEMSEEDLKVLLDASKPTVYMIFGGSPPSTPQENANRAWRILGEKMGFDSMTVEPITRKGDRFFMAVPVIKESN